MHRRGKYNEVIIDSAEYRDQLPTAIAAVFFTQEPDCATRTHRMIVDSYGIDPGQVLLLEHTPGASPGFKVHTPAKGEGEPDAADVPAAEAPVAEAAAEAHPDWKCEQPATWCVHAGATNAYRKCGGLPGHFCEDSEGKSGFYPCDEKVHATWGKVECAAKGEKQQTNGGGQQSSSKEQSPGDEICPKPVDWCSYSGATNEPKECGGQPGEAVSDAPMHQHMHPCAYAPTHQYCTDAPMHQCTNAPMHQCTNAPMHQCTNAPMLQCSTAPRPLLPRHLWQVGLRALRRQGRPQLGHCQVREAYLRGERQAEPEAEGARASQLVGGAGELVGGGGVAALLLII